MKNKNISTVNVEKDRLVKLRMVARANQRSATGQLAYWIEEAFASLTADQRIAITPAGEKALHTDDQVKE